MSSEWRPLEQILGPALCESFMFIGCANEIHLYKHRDTRRYLNIDRAGNCFRWSRSGYEPIGLDEAIGYVFS
jgi:hypothetical protein